MFRNPRENAYLPKGEKIPYSIGRSPSPPSSLPSGHGTERSPPAVESSVAKGKNMAIKSTPSKSNPAMQNRNSVKKNVQSATGKSKVLPNQTITSFFQKAAQPEDALFFGNNSNKVDRCNTAEEQDESTDELYEDVDRFHENGGSVKRRKTADAVRCEVGFETAKGYSLSKPDVLILDTTDEAPSKGDKTITSKRVGPFLEESESEDEGPRPQRSVEMLQSTNLAPSRDILHDEQLEPKNEAYDEFAETSRTLIRESNNGEGADFEGFENIEDFEEGPEEGEEYQERRWIEQQAQLEMEDGILNSDIIDPTIEGLEDVDMKEEDFDEPMETPPTEDVSALSCPICNVSLYGVSDSDTSIHVNNCLDGNPSPLPEMKPTIMTPITSGAAKLRRPTRPAKPGQHNPFSLTPSTADPKSAFARLMTNHAEDMAWKTAAASEVASRGKPAYQRTCPFYKILPGFSICVDAFRYGAVEGCQAYFLSHFHSDHYIGLTSNWSHGPIYCSKVTANLIRSQLRVESKFVIDLEFEEEREVPGTSGVKVTMIPANHCPGSSLFLFEKTIGKTKKRVLHCGDFRACRTHVEHPLLRPDVRDVISGKTREQKIDVCYLDTTYLNPKYAFPTQEDVINACADMCISLNPSVEGKDDGWETMKRERAGAGMVQFLENSGKSVPQEGSNGTAATPRGKLLVVVGTYSIGKERMCLGIAKALDSKIYAPASKQRIVACLEDAELSARMTNDPRQAQVHMTPLFEIRADTLEDYLRDFSDTFSRAVGFRPTGWNYRPPNSRFVEAPAVQTVLYGKNWKSGYTMKELVPQRGSTKRASCFGVPYSEHSSFRELTMFCCALRIEKIIPTVNVGSAKSRERMRAWVERWAIERKKSGLFKSEHF